MSDDRAVDEDRLSELAAAYDEALRLGAPVPPEDGVDSQALSGELKRTQAFLQRLERTWPRSPSPNWLKGSEHTPSDPASSTSLEPPSRLGRFRIERELGRGGCGVVLLAYDPKLRRRVALKIPRPEALWNRDMLRRFLREAEAAAGLDHPNVVPVYEVGEVPPVCYIAAAYCKGPSLAEWLRERPDPVPSGQAALLVAGVADAVQYAHRRGVLHRDLKPSNVLLEPTPEVPAENELGFIPRLTDFGLAKLLVDDGDQTYTSGAMGTPQFMAPEQAEGRLQEIGRPTDVYGLGAILYVLLTGRPPFRGETGADTLRQLVSDEPQPPRRLRPEVPRDLEAICLKCLEKAPGKRYAEAGELAEDLRRFLAGKPTLARPVGQTERLFKWIRRRPAITGLMLLSALAITGFIGGGVWHTLQLRELLELADDRGRKLREHLYVGDMKLAQQAWLNGDLAQVQGYLSRHQPGQSTDEPAGFEWGYLARKLAFEPKLTLSAHGGEVFSAAFSPDGKTLATAGQEATVKLWDVETGQLRGECRGHNDELNAVVFSPDGSLLASCSDDGTARLWDSVGARELKTLRGHADAVSCVGFSPAGDLLFSAAAWDRSMSAGGPSREVKAWNIETGEQIAAFPGHADNITSLAVSPDGKFLAAVGWDESVKLWEISTGSKRFDMQGHRSRVYSVAFSNDGRLLASGGGDNLAIIWRVADGRQVRVLNGHRTDIRSVTFSPDDRLLATAGSDWVTRLWEVETGRLQAVLAGHADRVWCVRFSPDGRTLVTTSRDGTAKLWDVTNVHDHTLITVDECVSDGAPPGWRTHLPTPGWWTPLHALSPVTGLFAIRSISTGYIHLRHVSAPEKSTRISGDFRIHAPVAISDDGQTLATVGPDKNISLWRGPQFRQRFVLRREKGQVARLLAVSSNGAMVAVSDDVGDFELWDTATGQKLLRLEEPAESVASVAFAPDGRCFASGGEQVKLWDVETGRCRVVLEGGWAGATVLRFSPDGTRLALAGGRHEVCLWTVSQHPTSPTILIHGGIVPDVAFSPDGKTLAAAGLDGTVKLWNTATAQDTLTLEVPGVRFAWVGFSCAPEMLVAATMPVANERRVYIWRGASSFSSSTSPYSDSRASLERRP